VRTKYEPINIHRLRLRCLPVFSFRKRRIARLFIMCRYTVHYIVPIVHVQQEFKNFNRQKDRIAWPNISSCNLVIKNK